MLTLSWLSTSQKREATASSLGICSLPIRVGKAWHLADMFLVDHGVLSCTLSSWHQDHIHCHLQTSLQFSSPCHLPSSSTIWHLLPIWSPCPHIASSTPSSTPPLEWSSHNTQLNISHPCHLETREGKGCFRRAALISSQAPTHVLAALSDPSGAGKRAPWLMGSPKAEVQVYTERCSWWWLSWSHLGIVSFILG